MNRLVVRLGILLLAAVLAGIAIGEEPAHGENPLDAEAFVAAARAYRIAAVSAPDEPFELVAKPLLIWSNPERSAPAGALFAYTRRGQPQVALCVYPNAGKLDHEFQSLGTEPLVAHRNGIVTWAPRVAGTEFKSINNALPPGSAAPLRLRQMRQLAHRFDAAILNAAILGGDSQRAPLRLLPTPIYRYPPDGLPAGVLDGAMFAFVQGTDPEVLLLIEAREGAGGERQWVYGLGRMSIVVLGVQLDGQAVWQTEPVEPYVDRDRVYYTVQD